MTVSPDLDRRFRTAAAAVGLLDVGFDVVDSPIGPLLVAATGRARRPVSVAILAAIVSTQARRGSPCSSRS